MIKERVSGIEFVHMARAILNGAKKYEDKMMSIRTDGDHIEVIRKPMPDVADHLDVTNPVTMAEGCRVYRHHCEHCYLTTHMAAILRQMSGKTRWKKNST